MKKLFFLILPLLLFWEIGCSDSGGGAVTDPFGTGGGGSNTGGVTFTVAVVQDNSGLYFEFKPSTSVVITKITANCAAAGVNNESVSGDGTTVYSSTNPAYVGPLTVIQSGQQWSFQFEGKIGSAQGQAYNVTANFTIP